MLLAACVRSRCSGIWSTAVAYSKPNNAKSPVEDGSIIVTYQSVNFGVSVTELYKKNAMQAFDWNWVEIIEITHIHAIILSRLHIIRHIIIR